MKFFKFMSLIVVAVLVAGFYVQAAEDTPTFDTALKVALAGQYDEAAIQLKDVEQTNEARTLRCLCLLGAGKTKESQDEAKMQWADGDIKKITPYFNMVMDISSGRLKANTAEFKTALEGMGSVCLQFKGSTGKGTYCYILKGTEMVDERRDISDKPMSFMLPKGKYTVRFLPLIEKESDVAHAIPLKSEYGMAIGEIEINPWVQKKDVVVLDVSDIKIEYIKMFYKKIPQGATFVVQCPQNITWQLNVLRLSPFPTPNGNVTIRNHNLVVWEYSDKGSGEFKYNSDNKARQPLATGKYEVELLWEEKSTDGTPDRTHILKSTFEQE